MLDIMQASFPGDPTNGTSKRKIDRAGFLEYSDQDLWTDGDLDVARSARLHVPPGGSWTPEGFIHAEETVEPRVLQRPDFEGYLDAYWNESSFKHTGGVPVVLDLVLSLGRARSTDTEHLQAFKSISSLALRTELESLWRFGEARQETIQFFHTTDSSHWNYHLHNLIFLT